MVFLIHTFIKVISSLFDFNCNSELPSSQLESQVVENTIIVPNFTTGGVVAQKVSPESAEGTGEIQTTHH